MVRWRLFEVLADREWSPYKLALEAGVNFPVVYRIAKQDTPVQRIEGRTLDAICRALGVQPGDLLEYVPDKKKGKK